MTTRPHYLRFVRALVLAAAVPACSGADDGSPQPATVDPAPSPPVDRGAELAQMPRPVASSTADAAADVAIDGELPKTSGPIVPPESVGS